MTGLQIPLFFDTYEEAVRAVVNSLGGFKKVGSMLWPSEMADDAGRKLASCLDTNKREKLDIKELALIRREARKAGVHILAAYEARDSGYCDPMPINPEDEAAQLQREYIAAVKGLQHLAQRIERNALIREPA